MIRFYPLNLLGGFRFVRFVRFVRILTNHLDDVRSLNYPSFIEWLNQHHMTTQAQK